MNKQTLNLESIIRNKVNYKRFIFALWNFYDALYHTWLVHRNEPDLEKKVSKYISKASLLL